jgi:hypothetical protein
MELERVGDIIRRKKKSFGKVPKVSQREDLCLILPDFELGRCE